ncbi:MAG: FAD-binding protein [Candidatus Aenigmarchaeota archaeon]|nr:FAD-binding protein [Candidatus Aenigmarchaeota archaeon]
MYDTIVVGAGISGLMTALRISEKGYKTLILEKTKELSAPHHGAEAMSCKEFGTLDIIKDSIVRKFNRMENISPNRTPITFYGGKHIVVKRPKLEKCLLEEVLSNNVDIKFSESFKGIKNSRILTGKNDYEANIVVGADGAVSTVRRFLGIKKPEKIIKCFQYHLIPPEDYDLETHREILSNEFCKGLCVWITPTEESVWLGLGTLEGNPKEKMHSFEVTKDFIEKSKILSNKFGFIPYGYSESFVSDNVTLVGDAAGCVNPISGGGLRRAAHSAELASKYIIETLETSSNCLKNYQIEWESIYKKDFDRKIELKDRYMRLFDSQINSGFEQIISNEIDVGSTEEIMKIILQLENQKRER